MIKSLKLVISEFLHNYRFEFFFLFFVLIFEGFIVALSVISIVPLADLLLDSSLENPSIITKNFIYYLNFVNLKPNLTIFIFIFISLNLTKSLFSTLTSYLILKIKYSVYKSLTKNILIDFLNTKWTFYSNNSQGKILNTINSLIGKVGSALGDFTMQLAIYIKFITYIITPLLLNAEITLITLSIVGLIMIPFFLVNKLAYKLGKKDVETSNILISVFNETLQAARIIIGFGKQNISIKKNIEALNDHLNVTIKAQTLQTFLVNLFQPISLLAASIALIVVYNNNSSLSELAAVFWSLLAALPLLTSVVKGNFDISNFLPSYEQLNNLRNEALKYKEKHGKIVFSNFNKNISLENLKFSYEKRNFTLNIKNFYIQKGKTVAIIGESGSGKSTLVDLIIGLQSADEGQIKYDGININDYNKNSIRQKIGFVPQETFLFNQSIKNNLLLSNENASNIEIIKALKLSNSYDFINKMPEGINTIVGDRGTKLSGGQKQRIALARAIISNPDILILDEATSSLDTQSEKLIQDSIEKLSDKVTIIIIAHRLSTIKKAEKVIILENGEIIEEGKVEDLINNKSSNFNKLLKSQNLIK